MTGATASVAVPVDVTVSNVNTTITATYEPGGAFCDHGGAPPLAKGVIMYTCTVPVGTTVVKFTAVDAACSASTQIKFVVSSEASAINACLPQSKTDCFPTAVTTFEMDVEISSQDAAAGITWQSPSANVTCIKGTVALKGAKWILPFTCWVNAEGIASITFSGATTDQVNLTWSSLSPDSGYAPGLVPLGPFKAIEVATRASTANISVGLQAGLSMLADDIIAPVGCDLIDVNASWDGASQYFGFVCSVGVNTTFLEFQYRGRECSAAAVVLLNVTSKDYAISSYDLMSASCNSWAPENYILNVTIQRGNDLGPEDVTADNPACVRQGWYPQGNAVIFNCSGVFSSNTTVTFRAEKAGVVGSAITTSTLVVKQCGLAIIPDEPSKTVYVRNKNGTANVTITLLVAGGGSLTSLTVDDPRWHVTTTSFTAPSLSTGAYCTCMGMPVTQEPVNITFSMTSFGGVHSTTTTVPVRVAQAPNFSVEVAPIPAVNVCKPGDVAYDIPVNVRVTGEEPLLTSDRLCYAQSHNESLAVVNGVDVWSHDFVFRCQNVPLGNTSVTFSKARVGARPRPSSWSLEGRSPWPQARRWWLSQRPPSTAPGSM